ncbi:DUF1489 family protein [Sphingomonas sp.]|uniref:DUF1489 family protein n=1 Tax=Sphingomonas sp. TaxID=28214 RepID=UPI001D1E3011|nr:DUF1489 family protein [Sphingomonas sp.]MBX9795312.1 DUF1489 domain-containing protein [Sphingomonas sp.]
MLHLTKVAFGAESLDSLVDALERRSATGQLALTTRYLPKRHEEISGLGSLFWILKHQLIARSPITGFGEADGGRVSILLGSPTVRVVPQPRRAHQGWRYLEAADAPPDLDTALAADGAALPAALAGDLSALGLI